MKAVRVALFACALAGSVAMNLVNFRSDRPPAHNGETINRSAARAPLLTLPRGMRAALASQRSGACREQLREVQAVRDELRRKLERFETPKELFAQSPTDSALGRSIANELRRHIRVAEGEPPADIECRGVVCRVGRASDAAAYAEPDQAWARRNIKSAMATRTDVYFAVRDRDVPAGLDILEDFVKNFRHSDALDRCTTRFGDGTSLAVRLNLAADDDEFENTPKGLSFRTVDEKLAGTPLGACILDALRNALDSVELPQRYTSAYNYPVVLPGPR